MIERVRGLGGVVGDWLERNSGRIGAAGALVGLAGSLFTAVGAAAAWLRNDPFLALGLVVAATVLFTLTWPRFRRRAWRTATEARLALVEQQDRSHLIDAIYAWRVEQGLDTSLKRVARLQVGLQHDPRLVQAEFGTDLTAPGVERSVQEAFERAQGRLLITGEPGSGKTTLALELVRHLLDQARTDPTAGVPELFPLASWARRPRPLLVWLEDELRQRGFGPRWIREGRLIPILDGLDEVDEDHRTKCLEAINDFRDFYEGRPLVVTCRLTEYWRLVADRPALAFGAGYVTQPLPAAQIIEYLGAAARSNPAWGQVREAIARGDAEELCRLWCTPLMLSVTVLAYAEGDPCELLGVDSPTERVWGVYVEAMRTRSLDPRHRAPANPEAPVGGVKPPYTSVEVRRWLGWLASSPPQRGEIWLHRLEPPPVRLFSARRAQAFASGVVYGLLLGFTVLLPILTLESSLPLVSRLVFWLVGGSLGGLVFGLFLGLAGWLISNPSYVPGSRSGSRRLALALAYGLTYWAAFTLALELLRSVTSTLGDAPGVDLLALGVPPALIFGMAVGMAGGLDEEPSYLPGWSVVRVRLARSLAGGLILGPIIVGLVFVLAVWLLGVRQAGSWFVSPFGSWLFRVLGYGMVLGMVCGLFYGLVGSRPPLNRLVPRPIHWLTESAKSGALLALAGGSVVASLYWLAATRAGGTRAGELGLLELALIFGPFFGLAGGLAAVLWHVVLRLRCWRRGLLSLRLVTFLDWSADHLYLQRVGGTYRWAHPTFVDYLAESSRALAAGETAATPRPTPGIREEEHQPRQPAKRTTWSSFLLTLAGFAAMAIAVILFLTLAVPRSTRPVLVDSLRSQTTTRPWYTSSDPSCRRSLGADGYYLVNTSATTPCSTWVSFIGTLTNVRMTADVAFRRTNAPSFAGLTCREGNGRGYRALISTSGYARITRIRVAAPNVILREERWTRSPSGAHRLRFDCVDKADGNIHLTLAVDGVRVVETSDAQRLPGGYVGMYASNPTGRSGVTEAVFTNLSGIGCGRLETTCR